MPVDVEAAMPPPASACSSSSIGKDSDECSPPGKEEEEEGEVQSAYTGAGRGLAGLEALEEALPIRRSISKFCNGKSKSFACLKEAITSSGSAKDITKAENAYSRKRKNLLAYSIMYENSHETAAAEVYETGPPKRPASFSRNSLVTLASSSSRSSSCISIEENEPPEQLQSRRSPDDCENSNSQKISMTRTGSTSPAPVRSLSMMDLHRLHRSSSSVRLKDKAD
ncbi:protein OXIDATIVE STRESS 3 LIKE 1-like [Phragmites australis]|uniref:protein OXIDATIVE STRESS 3 LIKE 1-like n=1 Tax=Phragmites australis TaxID=29695 RepID=UPI002D791E27|nr:protein OXIDATIVE STRESS 3 LIKE 1-like [Phragmites australis]